MIIDALIAAEKVLNISGDVKDAKKYINLTDDVLLRVERSTEPVSYSSVRIPFLKLILCCVITTGTSRKPRSS